MIDLQFYPTPWSLALQAISMFKDRNFKRIIDPSAGEGDLIKPLLHVLKNNRDRLPAVDAIEIDISKHQHLHAADIGVVGTDFLKHPNLSAYSHILMNPPFSAAAAHVMKAWELLWDGEIVAIINAETVLNPCDRHRRQLVRLIQQHGEVIHVGKPFMAKDAKIKADVQVAIVRLQKTANLERDVVGNLLTVMQEEAESKIDLGNQNYRKQLVLPNNTIENLVLIFDAAVKSARESVIASAKSSYYTNLIGKTMAETLGQEGIKPEGGYVIKSVQELWYETYANLKDRAWTSVLESADIKSKLSQKAMSTLQANFNQMKKMEFTVSNVYGFLIGLIESQGEMQLQMALDVFDSVTRYHTDNTWGYRGWVSNNKHRRAGYRIKHTRFILPGFEITNSGPGYKTNQYFNDLDRVFAMLDGKAESPLSLSNVARFQAAALRTGERVSSAYFDIRYYPGAGTIHFFPRDMKLVDRLNRLVGRNRGWIPGPDTPVHDSFWKQYENADKYANQVEKELAKLSKGRRLRFDSGSEEEQAEAHAVLDKALENVHTAHQLEVKFEFLLGGQASETLMLAGEVAEDVNGAPDAEVLKLFYEMPTELVLDSDVPQGTIVPEGSVLLRTYNHRNVPLGDKVEWVIHSSYKWAVIDPREIDAGFLEVFEKWCRDYGSRTDLSAIAVITEAEQEALFLRSHGRNLDDLDARILRRLQRDGMVAYSGLPYETTIAMLQDLRCVDDAKVALELPSVIEEEDETAEGDPILSAITYESDRTMGVVLDADELVYSQFNTAPESMAGTVLEAEVAKEQVVERVQAIPLSEPAVAANANWHEEQLDLFAAA